MIDDISILSLSSPNSFFLVFVITLSFILIQHIAHRTAVTTFNWIKEHPRSKKVKTHF